MDAAAYLEKIFKAVDEINKAVETARQNKEDCIYVKSRVKTLRNTFEQYKTIVEVAENNAMKSTLDIADGVLADALTVVTECQKEKNIMCVLCGAGELSKALSKVDGRITSVITDFMFAVVTYLAMKLAERAAQKLDAARHSKPWYHRLFTWMGVFTRPRPTNFDQLSLPQKITEVAGEIEEETETIHCNKVDFTGIQKSASSVSALMSPLENYREKKLVKKDTMKGALEKLLNTFSNARKFVKSHRGIRIDIILQPNRKLVQELDEVLDEMLDGIGAVNIIIMNDLPGLRRSGGNNGETSRTSRSR